MHAIEQNFLDMVHWLIDEGANIEQTNHVSEMYDSNDASFEVIVNCIRLVKQRCTLLVHWECNNV